MLIGSEDKLVSGTDLKKNSFILGRNRLVRRTRNGVVAFSGNFGGRFEAKFAGRSVAGRSVAGGRKRINDENGMEFC